MDLRAIKNRFNDWNIAYATGLPTQDITARLLAKEVGGLVAEIERMRLALDAIATGKDAPLKIADAAVWAQKVARAALGKELVTPCVACEAIGGAETEDGWQDCDTCEACGFLVNGRPATFDEYMRLTGGSRISRTERK